MTGEIQSYEEALERHFSTETQETEKNSFLKTVQELKSKIGWNIIQDDSLCNKERGPEVFSDLMIHFNFWKSNNLWEYVSFQRTVLYRLAKICFFYCIGDSEVVSEVLRLVYKCDGCFYTMLFSIVYQNGESTIEERIQKEYLTNLYFLTHAHKAKLEFSGVRYVDCKGLEMSPVSSAAYFNHPNLVLLFLRHGAIVQECFSFTHAWNLKNLLQYLISILRYWIGSETNNSWEAEINSIDDSCRCLRYLLRVIRQIPISELQFTLMSFEDNLPEGAISDSRSFIRSVSDRGFVPNLMSRYVMPSELRHLCRLAIRDALNKNWNLPYGIFSLPLPKVLQRYVNLSED